jgi:class 3 adenylate cyclase
MASVNVIEEAAKALDVALAVADVATWTIEFENAKFFQWFPPDADDVGDAKKRLPALPLERAESRLSQGRPFAYEAEIKSGVRTLTISVSLKAVEIAGAQKLVIEGSNISKQKEAEYMLDSYSRLAEKNARELQREKERAEKLLLNIMPRVIYEELKDFGTTTPQRFDNTTVLMTDFVGFTEMAISQDPGAVVTELNDIFSAFDRVVELFGCERIKTIGDSYVAVSGLPEPTPDHAINIAKVALRFKRYLERRNSAHPTKWYCRIGVATGPLIGSIVGIQKYVYDIFGPAVNLAARLEALSESMQITMDAQTRELIEADFVAASRGTAELKGFGEREIFTLVSERPSGR